jgi:predicted transposase/invertase (TIGR01784 family)
VVFWKQRSIAPELAPCYQHLLDCGKLTIVYLNELDWSTEREIGPEIIKLIIVEKEEAKQQVNKLFSLIDQEQESETKKKDLIELVEKILVYKFENYTREELDKMFTLTDFKKTRFYQDTFREGRVEGRVEGQIELKLKSIPKMFRLGIPKEQIATILEVDLDFIDQVLQQESYR